MTTLDKHVEAGNVPVQEAAGPVRSTADGSGGGRGLAGLSQPAGARGPSRKSQNAVLRMLAHLCNWRSLCAL